jgi:hypothetical protein
MIGMGNIRRSYIMWYGVLSPHGDQNKEETYSCVDRLRSTEPTDHLVLYSLYTGDRKKWLYVNKILNFFPCCLQDALKRLCARWLLLSHTYNPYLRENLVMLHHCSNAYVTCSRFTNLPVVYPYEMALSVN